MLMIHTGREVQESKMHMAAHTRKGYEFLLIITHSEILFYIYVWLEN